MNATAQLMRQRGDARSMERIYRRANEGLIGLSKVRDTSQVVVGPLSYASVQSELNVPRTLIQLAHVKSVLKSSLAL